MAGLYVHIPFCRKACHYCDFHFSTSLKTKDLVVAALSKEVSERSGELSEPIETIYFGGGTPSLLSAEELEVIFKAIHANYSVNSDAEITLEANPEDVTPNSLEDWKPFGINRLSIGVQSFDDEILAWMNRNHSSKEALQSIRLAQDAGIENLSLDLIYGVPHRSLEDWQYEIEQAIGLNTPHISAYCLTIEPQTVFGSRAVKGEQLTHADAQSASEFKLLRKMLAEAKIGQYEISNFSAAGYKSQHNSNYWNGAPYLGFGPGAHSYNAGVRSWNVSNNSVYAKGIMAGTKVSESEQLTPTDAYNEYIMTHLRMTSGLDLSVIQSEFKVDMMNMFSKEIRAFSDQKLVNTSDNVISLTVEGLLMADKISSELFLTHD